MRGSELIVVWKLAVNSGEIKPVYAGVVWPVVMLVCSALAQGASLGHRKVSAGFWNRLWLDHVLE